MSQRDSDSGFGRSDGFGQPDRPSERPVVTAAERARRQALKRGAAKVTARDPAKSDPRALFGTMSDLMAVPSGPNQRVPTEGSDIDQFNLDAPPTHGAPPPQTPPTGRAPGLDADPFALPAGIGSSLTFQGRSSAAASPQRVQPPPPPTAWPETPPVQSPTPMDLVGIPSGFFDVVDGPCSNEFGLEVDSLPPLSLDVSGLGKSAKESRSAITFEILDSVAPRDVDRFSESDVFDFDLPSTLGGALSPPVATTEDLARKSEPGGPSRPTTVPPESKRIIRPSADASLSAKPPLPPSGGGRPASLTGTHAMIVEPLTPGPSGPRRPPALPQPAFSTAPPTLLRLALELARSSSASRPRPPREITQAAMRPMAGAPETGAAISLDTVEHPARSADWNIDTQASVTVDPCEVVAAREAALSSEAAATP